MTENNNPPPLDQNLKYLKLPFMREHYQELAKQASQKHWSHVEYLEKLTDGEAALRRDRSIQRRIRLARFPIRDVKTTSRKNTKMVKMSIRETRLKPTLFLARL